VVHDSRVGYWSCGINVSNFSYATTECLCFCHIYVDVIDVAGQDGQLILRRENDEVGNAGCFTGVYLKRRLDKDDHGGFTDRKLSKTKRLVWQASAAKTSSASVSTWLKSVNDGPTLINMVNGAAYVKRKTECWACTVSSDNASLSLSFSESRYSMFNDVRMKYR
jgi:hypothetical protein